MTTARENFHKNLRAEITLHRRVLGKILGRNRSEAKRVRLFNTRSEAFKGKDWWNLDLLGRTIRGPEELREYLAARS